MSKCLHILYFAALGETLGCREEDVRVEGVRTLGELRDWLSNRGIAWQAIKENRVRMAINQQVADVHQNIEDGDEIAFFPPVTGG